MKDFDNNSNLDREYNEYYNNTQSADSYGGYNNNNDSYNNASFYGNYSNNSYSSNDNYNNFNSNYNNNENYSSNNNYNNNNFNNNYNDWNSQNNTNNNDILNDILNDVLKFLLEFCQKHKKEIKKVIILTVIGFCSVAILISLGMSAFNSASPEVRYVFGKMFIMFIFAIFALAGGFVMLQIPIQNHRKKKRCQYEITATVINLKKRVSHKIRNGRRSTSISFRPEYEFCYMGKNYIVMDKSARNFKIGDKINMRINEKDPYDIYVKSVASDIFSIFMGLVFFAFGVFGVVICILF